MPFRDYLRELQRNLKGRATERTHYPALKSLLEALDPKIEVFIEAGHVTAVGNLDFEVRRKMKGPDFPLGWIEAKEPGADLDAIEKSDQLKRYRKLHNLILTDFVELRLYQDGKRVLTARLGAVLDGKLRPDAAAEAEVRQLLSQFLRAPFAPPRNPAELAKRMAALAHIIRDITLNTFKTEPETGDLHAQYEAFKQTLIPDLSPDQFADMYAQTVAYGLFAAACQPRPATEPFTRERAAYLIPKTNPFLRKLFNRIAGPELAEPLQPFVKNLAALLDRTDFNSILADFGKRTGKEDPVVHFYEDFLQAYDPKVREMRGVYYTPEPVVLYIVRSIDHLLKTRFNKPDGLADPSVLILDPACGTGTFLYYVIRHIYDHLCAKGQQGAWNSYVSQNLLKRVFGFELLMAPYAIAHLKLGLLLQELGYDFHSDERLGIYLTNTLEEAIKRSEVMFAQWIADEANAAAEIKKEKPIMVVLGNPPYSGHSANKGPWITALMEDYKKECPELYKPAQAKWLQDDYVKFIRFAQWRIDKTGEGILGFITNHAYVDNPTFRCMRSQLRKSFSDIYVLDLHGSSKRHERAPDGGLDENVFDIQQGVAIGLFVKQPQAAGLGSVRHSNVWGDRTAKNGRLTKLAFSEVEWREVTPDPHFHLFCPQDQDLLAEYNQWPKLNEVMDQNGDAAPGIVTTQDQFAISFTPDESKRKVETLLRTETEDEARRHFRLCTQSQWNYERARRELSKGKWKAAIHPILYRPFDTRWTVFDPNVAVHRRERVMNHMLAGKNLGISTTRSVEIGRGFEHVLCSRNLIQHHTVSLKEVNYLFPLYLYRSPQILTSTASSADSTPQLNYNPHFLVSFKNRLGLGAEATLSGEDVFFFMYAVLHSVGYRRRYAEFLKIDFPRVPLTRDKGLFRALVEKGRELVSLHLMESPKLSNFITHFPVSGSNTVEKVRFEESRQGTASAVPKPAGKKKAALAAEGATGRAYINKEQYFDGVPKNVWEFHIGGYQVCEKWLKDRKGRQLSNDDLNHYQKIVVALNETIRLMREIDDVIPAWPLP